MTRKRLNKCGYYSRLHVHLTPIIETTIEFEAVTNPKGLKNSARGCEARATLGNMQNILATLQELDRNSPMSQSLSKIIIHTVFSTKDRVPVFRDKVLREDTHAYLGGILLRHDCLPIVVGGVEDHVHMLSTLSRTCDAAEMVKEVKRGSSLWLKAQTRNLEDFAWQNGYGIFSIGFSQIKATKKYIEGQEKRHRKESFHDEYRKLLNRYEIKFDERYVWD